MKKLILFLGAILGSISLLNAQYTISPSDPFVSNGGGTWGSILKMRAISINSGKGVRFSIHKLDDKEFSQTGKFYLRSGSQTGTDLASKTLISGDFSAFIDLEFGDSYYFPMKIFAFYQPNNTSGNAWVGSITINNHSSQNYFGLPVDKSSVLIDSKEDCSFNSTNCAHEGYYHAGIDYAPESGENIQATAAGTVVVKTLLKEVGYNRGFGNCVIIEHQLLDGSLKYSLYAHLNSISPSLSEGTYVRKGDFLGVMGKTGSDKYSKHLHFEIKDAPVLYNPSGEGEHLAYPPNDATGYGYENPNDYFNKVQFAYPVCTVNEPNNTYIDATYISTIGKNFDRPEIINSCLDFTIADEDWYSVNITNKGKLTITLTNEVNDFDVGLFNGNTLLKTSTKSGNLRTIEWCNNSQTNSCEQLSIKVYTNQSWSTLNFDYSLKLDWDFNNGCTGFKSNKNIGKTTNSGLTITGDTEICEGESTTLSVSGGGNYKWFANNNEIGTGSSISISDLPLGENQIAVIDEDNTCSSGGNAVVTVNEGISANAGNNVTIQNGASTQLQGSGGTTYSWSPSTGLSNSNISNPIASPTETITYTLTTTKNGCSDTDEVTVTVSQNSNTIDIMVDDIWTVPANPKEGEDVDLYVRVKNIGTEKLYSVNWNYYIDNNVVGSDDYFALEPNETREEFFNNYKFSSSGTFNYCVKIESEPNEQNTSNNEYCKQVIIGDFISEDITVSNVIINNSNIDAGDTFIPSAQLNYNGDRTTNELPDVKLGYYLSKDCNFSNDDVFLDEEVFSLGSDNTSESDSEVVKIPPATEAGNYYILVVADHTNLITESNESNNTYCKGIVINSSSTPIIEGGLVNPVNNLIIHEDNRSAYFSNGNWDDMQIDGWSSTGKVSWIKLYYKSVSSVGSSFKLKQVSNPNNGSWVQKIDITGGVYEVYVTVKCDYNGCAQNGVDSEIRQFTYVKPYVPGNFYAYNRSDDVRIDIYPNYNFGNSLNTGFYYRVFRNTSPSISGGMYLGNWTQEEIVMDTNTNPNQTYYYWVDVAMDGNGNYNSGLVETEYVEVKTPTLSTKNIDLSKFINIYPNPTKEFISISYDNSLKVNNVSIFDVKGRLILTESKKFDKISTRKLSNGVYIISIKTNKGTISKKIIKN